jgi:hypothetical protein
VIVPSVIHVSVRYDGARGDSFDRAFYHSNGDEAEKVSRDGCGCGPAVRGRSLVQAETKAGASIVVLPPQWAAGGRNRLNNAVNYYSAIPCAAVDNRRHRVQLSRCGADGEYYLGSHHLIQGALERFEMRTRSGGPARSRSLLAARRPPIVTPGYRHLEPVRKDGARADGPTAALSGWIRPTVARPGVIGL